MVDRVNTRPGRVIGVATTAAEAPPRQHPEAITLRFGGAVVGTLVALAGDGRPLVDFPANPSHQHLAARTCVALTGGDVGKSVVLQFDEGDYLKPLIMGVVQLVGQAVAPGEAALAPASAVTEPPPNRVDIDGMVIELVAAESLTLRCGSASITLTRDGKVLARGTQVHTRATALNRIQGASVRIN